MRTPCDSEGIAKRNPEAESSEVANMMLDPRYLRQSSSLIQESLQKGFDVLQLANGDIVTTGSYAGARDVPLGAPLGPPTVTRNESLLPPWAPIA